VKAPLLTSIAIASQTVPAVAFLFSRHRTRAALLIVIGALVSFGANLVGRVLAATSGNNQVVSYISSPLTAACFFGALMSWQLTRRERRVFRFGTLCFLLIWVLLVALVEDMRNFDLVTGPLYSITFLIAGAWTMLRRAGETEVTPFQQSDWFWIAGGIAVHGACTALASPIGAILIARHRYDLFNIAWQVRAFFVTVSFLLLGWGVFVGPSVSKYSTVE
jgi:hypothetical protein